jgi:GNAT superfamily N-acetyltransferase
MVPFSFKPLTKNEWPDLEKLFNQIPAATMCWCMYWRKSRSNLFGNATGNHADFKTIVEPNEIPGILAYAGKDPVGWCAIAPRAALPGLDRSPTLKRVDGQEVWSITCFVIDKAYRRKGLTTMLTKEAVHYAAQNGARIIEAYPLINPDGKYRMVAESFMGFASTFGRLGFQQVSDLSRARNIMRLYITGSNLE